MTTEQDNAEATLEKAVAILERDAFRCDGAIGYDRILALAQKFRLSADALVSVRHRLIGLEITIDSEPSDLPEESGDDRDEDADADADPSLPESEAPESIEDPAYQNAIARYLAEAGAIDLLSPKEEVELMRRIRAGELARRRLAADSNDPDCTLARIGRDGERARHDFINANLRLVVAMAKTTARAQMSFEDLVQEGNFGLLRAVEKFDHTRGLRFSTYATWWIWASMQRAIHDRSRLVRVPVYLRNRLTKLRRLETGLSKERKGVPPTDTELAEHLSWSVESIQFLRDLDIPPLSLDAETRDGDDREPLGARMSAASIDDPEGTVGHRQIVSAVVGAIDGLNERERLVMQLRFGLTDGEDHTLEEIGEKLGVTRERVRQIQNTALERIRHPSRSKVIAELVDAAVTIGREGERELDGAESEKDDE